MDYPRYRSESREVEFVLRLSGQRHYPLNRITLKSDGLLSGFFVSPTAKPLPSGDAQYHIFIATGPEVYRSGAFQPHTQSHVWPLRTSLKPYHRPDGYDVILLMKLPASPAGSFSDILCGRHQNRFPQTMGSTTDSSPENHRGTTGRWFTVSEPSNRTRRPCMV